MKLHKLKTKARYKKHFRRDQLNDLSHWDEVSAEWTGARPKNILRSPLNGKHFLFKMPKYGKLESMVEVFNSILANELEVNHVQYFPASFNGQLGVCCQSFIEPGSDQELWEMKELICRYSTKPDIEGKFGRSKEVLEEHNLENIYMAIDTEFGENAIFKQFFKMVGYDILIGHGDRHWENYGFIVESGDDFRVRYSPVYDTASGYLLEVSEEALPKFIPRLDERDWYRPKNLPKLCKISVPNNVKGNHFDLLEYILEDENMKGYMMDVNEPFRRYHPTICRQILNNFFKEMPTHRQEIIQKVLNHRWQIGLEIFERYKKS